MGLYGSPQLKPPVPYGKALRVCKACHLTFDGNFCPYCGTKAGDKKPHISTPIRDLIIFTIGAVVGVIAFNIGVFIGMGLK